MANHSTHEPIPEEAIARDHEQRDLSIGMLAGSLIGLLVLLAVSMLAMAMLSGWFESRVAASAAPVGPLGRAELIPPQPRLERQPAEIRLQYEASLEQIMNSYGWLERDASAARIPVARAMEIVAREGLPASTGPAGPDSDTERD